MKSFYVLALLITVGLAASPFLLLEKTDKDRYADKVVRYDTYSSGIKSIDPATCGDSTSSTFQGQVYEGLYTYHFLKRPLEVIPQLAADMPEISDDAKVYTIRIKPNVKYQRNECFGVTSDGKRQTRTVQAKDFVLAFKRIADYHINTGLAWAFSNHIKGIKDYRRKTQRYNAGDFSRYDIPVEGLEAIDEHTLRFELEEPYPQFLYVLAMSVTAPVPREAVDYWLATEDKPGKGRRAIPRGERTSEFKKHGQLSGTGAYMITEWERKDRLVMERNPDYRKAFYPSEGMPEDRKGGLLEDAGKRVPFIDVLHYDFAAESYSAWMLFLSRQRDIAGIPRESFDSVINPGRDLRDRWRKRGIRLIKHSTPAVYWIVFNMEDPIIGQSKSLRQALSAAMDVESYLDVLFNNRGKRAVNILPRSFKGWEEAGPGRYYQLNMELAKKKIEEAKRELAAKDLLDKDGRIPLLKLDLAGTGRHAAEQGTFFKQQFAKIGVRLESVPNDWPKLQQKVHNKQTQMYTMGWVADYPDAQNFLQLFYSPNITKQTNNSNYSNPEFDRLYEKVRVMTDSPERTELYAKMVNIISEDCPVLLLTEPLNFILVYDWMHNVKPHPIGTGYSKYRRIDTELRHEMGGRE